MHGAAMHTLAGGTPALALPRPLSAPRGVSRMGKATRHAIGNQLIRRRAVVQPRSLLTFPPPGPSERQQAAPRRQPEPAPVRQAGVKARPPLQARPPPRPVLVEFRVPEMHLEYGEHLRVVGAAPELGAWDPLAGPALEWTPGDCWTGRVALQAGQHEFKLVAMLNGGGARWEEGPNRRLRASELPGGCAAEAAGAPVLRAACPRFGDTATTTVTADRAQLQAAAEAAVARAAALLRKEEAIEGQLGALQQEAEESERRVADLKHDTRRAMHAELVRLQQRGLVAAQVARLEAQAAAGQESAEHGRQAEQAGEPAAGAAGAAELVPVGLQLTDDSKLAAAVAAIQAALAPAAAPAEEQRQLCDGLLGEEQEQEEQEQEEPQLGSAALLRSTNATDAAEPAEGEPLGHWQELERQQVARDDTAAAALAGEQPTCLPAAEAEPAPKPPLAASEAAAAAGLRRVSTHSDGSVFYSFAAAALAGEPQQQSALQLAMQSVAAQLPPKAAQQLQRQLQIVGHTHLASLDVTGTAALEGLPQPGAAPAQERRAASLAAAAAAAAAAQAAEEATIARLQAEVAALELEAAAAAAAGVSGAAVRAAAELAAGVQATLQAVAAEAQEAETEEQVEPALAAEAAAKEAVPSHATATECPAADSSRVSLKLHSLPGVAACLVAQSMARAGSLLWGVVRGAVPAAHRRAADAAAWLAAGVAAVALLK